MKKSRIQKTAVICMSICLMAGMLPVSAYAAPAASGNQEETTAYTINLNRGGEIAGITTPVESAVGEWEGSEIYFGQIDGEPLQWRILDPDGEAVIEETALDNRMGQKVSAMLLQTTNIIGQSSFDSDNKLWIDSDIRALLNEEDGFLKEFGAYEKEAIPNVYKEETEATAEGTEAYTNPALEGDKVFLLSAEEALKEEYGYSTHSGRRLTVSGGDAAVSWWLRSAPEEADGEVAVIDKDGKLTSIPLMAAEEDGSEGTEEAEAGLAPALYLEKEKILFTTPAGSNKSASLKQIEEAEENGAWKLTLCSVEESLDAAIVGNAEVQPGESVTLSHSKAETVLEEATRISAILTDSNGVPIYYGKVNTTGKTTTVLTIPEELTAGSYGVYLFAEEVNGENETDYASALGNPLTITVKVTPTIQTSPDVAPVTYGQNLGNATITGGIVVVGEEEIPGSFAWKNSTMMPSVADSNNTLYEAIFTPQDTSLYYPVTVGLKLTVAKAENAPNMPENAMVVDYSIARVEQISLPAGWSFVASDVEKALTAGGSIQVTARYWDMENYQNCEQTITITRQVCVHSGGNASCTARAICEICGEAYGNVEASRHGETQLVNAREADCGQTGYTGDTCCKACGQVLTPGQELAALEHEYSGVVTQEPNTEHNGIRTFTCGRCGHQYQESIDRHIHYYNNEKTVHWQSCVQQGEVHRWCACGDTLVDITPALGHDFKAEITTQPTTDHAGVKTYVCQRCSYSYAEAIPKLVSSDNTQSGTNTNNHSSKTERVPFLKENSSIEGWKDINKEIGKAAEGDTISIYMNDALILPAEALKAIKGRNVTLLLDIGNDMKWSICGLDVTGESLNNLNLKVVKNTNTIPAELVKELAGEKDTMQLTLVHEGDFGCTANLQVLLDSDKAGYYANLFYYNENTGKLEYCNSDQMDGRGIGSLALTHASEYLVVMDTIVIDGTEEKEEEEIKNTESIEAESPIDTIPIETITPDTETNDNAVIIFVLILLVVLGLTLLLVVALRTRKATDR